MIQQITLSEAIKLRLLELWHQAQGAQSAVNGAVATAQAVASRYNDAIGVVRETYGVNLNSECRVDFATGALLVMSPDPEQEVEPVETPAPDPVPVHEPLEV